MSHIHTRRYDDRVGDEKINDRESERERERERKREREVN